MIVDNLPLDQLKPATYNPRKISPEAFSKLTRSIETFGLVDPLIINKRTGYTIVGGHQRYEALKLCGQTTAPCVVLDIELEREQLLNMALNNQNLQGEFDFTRMADLLIEFDAKNIDASIAGFSDQELEQIANWTTSAQVQPNTRASPTSIARCPNCGNEFNHDVKIYSQAK